VEDVVIVGAGPAGLAAAAALRTRGTDAIILEQGQHVGEQWRSRYDRLHLHTIRWLSDLPGYRIPREFGRWVARDQFVQYLEQYAAHHGLEPQFGVEATRIDRDDGHWAIRTSSGTIPARVVVMASGYTRVPYLPRWPGIFDGPMVHSAVYRNPGPYRGQDVLVIGAGNSGTEIAVVTPIGEHGIPSPQPHLHFIGIGIPISGLLHQVGKDSRQTAASVAHERRALDQAMAS